MMHGVDCSPCALFGLIFRGATLLVAFLYVFGLTFLFLCVFAFVASRHLSNHLPTGFALVLLASANRKRDKRVLYHSNVGLILPVSGVGKFVWQCDLSSQVKG